MVASTTSQTGAISRSLTIGLIMSRWALMRAVSILSTEMGPRWRGPSSRSWWITSLATSGLRSHSTMSPSGNRAEALSTVTLTAPALAPRTSSIADVPPMGLATRMWYMFLLVAMSLRHAGASPGSASPTPGRKWRQSIVRPADMGGTTGRESTRIDATATIGR